MQQQAQGQQQVRIVQSVQGQQIITQQIIQTLGQSGDQNFQQISIPTAAVARSTAKPITDQLGPQAANTQTNSKSNQNTLLQSMDQSEPAADRLKPTKSKCDYSESNFGSKP